MDSPKAHSDQRYIEALLHNDSVMVREIYEKFSGKVVAFIKKNNGDDSDARDVIQETLIVIYKQAFEKKLVLTCPFDAYFFLLCKRRWWNKLKNTDRKEVTIEEDLASVDRQSEQTVDSTELYELKSKLLIDKLNAMSEKCRELIKLTMKIDSMKTVAEKLGVSYAYVRKKKSICMGHLTELVRKSKEYKNINEL
ncbi:sigma-70 family RNA polymerase sigma factor [Fulvivirga sp. 29W222]|uniref:Sigma-70 family RNA polymerase sigma factor n=1 Tax=Fulvivirga marina TaxID=2494733 RepID=A0A937FYW4_9BACT|nr:sigma-70 family RNA polymerase sigma factor [Fulvivirga marina]MBL6447038.1 sigma-70 family RNA polymerase sigma factor [Fulvivirga marina]